MAPPPALLRGGGIPPSTFSYVLGLVGRSYLPPTRSLYLSTSAFHAATTRSTGRRDATPKVWNRSHLSSSSSSSLPSPRHASSAHAVLEYDPPPDYSHPGPSAGPSLHPLHRSLPPLPLPLPPALARLRPRTTSAASYRALFESSNCIPLHLASPKRLADVTQIFLRSGEPSTWAWLSGQLGHLISDLDAGGVRGELAEVKEGAKALRSYALTELDQWEYARRELAGTDNIHNGSLGFKHGLRALVFGRMGRWDSATQGIRRSVARWTEHKSRAYGPLDMDLVGRYLEILRVEEREAEMWEVVSDKRVQDRLRRPANTELIDAVYRSLADLPDPTGSLWGFARTLPPARARMVSSTLVNALLRYRPDEALEVVQSCVGAGIAFSPVEMGHFTSALKSAGLGAELEQLSSTLPETSKARFELLERLTQAGDSRRRNHLDEAWTDLTSQHTPTRAEILAYARGLARLGRADDTRAALLPLFGDSLERNPTSLTILHTAHCAAFDIDMSCRYLDKLLAIRPKIDDFNRTLAVIAAHADVPFTVELFDSILEHGLKPDAASYTTLISLFANRHDPENAQNVFEAMQEAGFSPDPVAWAALLNAYVEGGDWEGAAIRYEGMPPDMKADQSVATTVLKALVLLSSPTDRIMRIFRSMASPSKYVWALAIQSAADNGDLVLTRDLYEEMEAASLASPNSPKPGVHVYSILLHAYLRAGFSESAREVYDEMLRQGIVPTSVTYGMVVASFSRLAESKSMLQAEVFADDIYKQSKRERALEAARARGSIEENLFGPLLAASAKEGNVDNALDYFSQASTSTTTAASIPTYSKLMDAYRRSGNADSVLEIWKQVLALAVKSTTHRISSATSTATSTITRTRKNDNLVCIPLSITLDALSAAGRYFDVKKVWADVQSAGFGFDSQNYNHYAIALARTGDIESAFSIVDRIMLPKWDEIRTRRVAALREQKSSETLQISMEGVSPWDGDDPSHTLESPGMGVPPAFRPPNRRDEHRWQGADPTGGGGSSGSKGTAAMLEKWRPSDALWRPSKLTISVLEHGYRQLEEAKRRSLWMALPGDREDDPAEPTVEGAGAETGPRVEGEGKQGEQITFPSFNNVPLRDQNGAPRKESAGMMLVKLNRRYLRVVSLITLHRRKQRAREAMDRRAGR